MTGALTRFLLALTLGVPLTLNAQSYTGPYATMANVRITVQGNEVNLRLEERVAFLFIVAIDTLEEDCRYHMKRLCTMSEMVNGVKAPDDWPMRVLAYDPATDDTSYTYDLTLTGIRWKLVVTPKKERLGGFYEERGTRRFNAKGAATAADPAITAADVDGESFAVRRK